MTLLLSYTRLYLNLTEKKDAAPMPTEDVCSQVGTSKVCFIVPQSPPIHPLSSFSLSVFPLTSLLHF